MDSEKESDRVWSMYQEIGVIERHFNEIESSYRKLASSWLLAAFAAIGFVLSEKLFVVSQKEIVIGAIGLSASIGLYLLWTIDLLVYHKLLDAAFLEGRKLEREYQWLPQIRDNMMHFQSGSGVLPNILLFYLISIELMIAIAVMSFIVWCSNYGISLMVVSSILGVIAMIAIGVHLVHATENTSSLEKQLQRPADELDNS